MPNLRRRPRTAKLLLAAVLAVLATGAATAQPWNRAGGGLSWARVPANAYPGNDAVIGGPGDDPEPGSLMFVCRAPYRGGTHPGKWVKGNCNISFGGAEVVMPEFEVAYGSASWVPFQGERSLIQTGAEADGTPLYSCRVRLREGSRDRGFHPGKIVHGECNVAFDGRELVQRPPFEVLQAAGNGGYRPPPGWQQR